MSRFPINYSNYPPGVTDNDLYFTDETESADEAEDFCPICNEPAFVDGHCSACDYDVEGDD